ncbi:MAG: indolepyruvate ferredoxin oxidoreductase, partial [Bacteroidaceae bacterium]|nr:indolepyruvate ferredoxin oxidoreductase [Bacteroidaceae bacterium]
MKKILLLGDEAIALGALHAGLSGVYAYPGTPSTEITEFIQASPLAKERKVRSRWCTNEKTAMEAALGMSYAGKRALVCMKHVGMNVCADAFVNSAITGVNGGVIVLAADDPSMHSSQNEQDSRFYGKFAMIPIMEPSTQQEAYDMMPKAFALSESLKLPVLMRIVTRMAHSRAAVEIGEPIEQNQLSPDNQRTHWVLLPGNARRQYLSLIDKQPAIEEAAEMSAFNQLFLGKQSALGIIAPGTGFNYVQETHAADISVLKVSQYPLPTQKIKELASHCSQIMIVEDGQPFVEEQVKSILGAGYPIIGRLTGVLPRTGELNPDNVAKALGIDNHAAFEPAKNMAGRPPQLCQGCGHRSVYQALNEVAKEYEDPRIFG